MSERPDDLVVVRCGCAAKQVRPASTLTPEDLEKAESYEPTEDHELSPMG